MAGDSVLDGNWTTLKDEVCPGEVEVWDQTIGCPACGMNLWHLPEFGQWPEWDKENEPPEDRWEDWRLNTEAFNPCLSGCHPSLPGVVPG